MKRVDRLKEWINTLPEDKVKEIAVICIDGMIDSDYIHFPEGYKVPYWDNDGENIDGSEQEYEELI